MTSFGWIEKRPGYKFAQNPKLRELNYQALARGWFSSGITLGGFALKIGEALFPDKNKYKKAGNIELVAKKINSNNPVEDSRRGIKT